VSDRHSGSRGDMFANEEESIYGRSTTEAKSLTISCSRFECASLPRTCKIRGSGNAVTERTEPHPVRATDELEHWFEPWRDATPQHLADRARGRWAEINRSRRVHDTTRCRTTECTSPDNNIQKCRRGRKNEKCRRQCSLSRRYSPTAFWSYRAPCALRSLRHQSRFNGLCFRSDYS